MKRKRRSPAILEGRPPSTPEEFAERYFGDSEKHCEAALGLVRRLEEYSGYDLSGLHPDDRIMDLLPEPDTLDLIEMMMERQSEEELKSVSQKVSEGLRIVLAQQIMKAILGPAADACTWDPPTIYVRSVRGIVNELEKLGSVPSGLG